MLPALKLCGELCGEAGSKFVGTRRRIGTTKVYSFKFMVMHLQCIVSTPNPAARMAASSSPDDEGSLPEKFTV